MKINILEYFEETVLKAPNKTAIIDGERKTSFSELAELAKKLSYAITENVNETICRPIAVFLPKCTECIVSDLAIVYSGNAYMNLDVKTPPARIEAILDRIQPLIIISDRSNTPCLPESWAPDKIMILDEIKFDSISVKQQKIDNILAKIIDTDPLCIINTSGSTGTPKGVVLNHRSFIDFTEWANNKMNFTEYEIMGCLSPVVFDIYCYEMCLLMSKSGTMVLLNESYAAFPARLLQTLSAEKVTFIFWVPTIMVNIANMKLLERIPLPSIRTVWFAGEVFPTKQFNIWRHSLKNAQFVNMYGPIEITLDCTHYIVERELKDDEPIPIGYAMRNTDILILNEKDEKCKLGEEGEICVRGTSLAMGYYNNPEKTGEAFVQNPLNHSYPELIYRTGDIGKVNHFGEIIFCGRKDTLIKHMGYRIELAEIEHVIINVLKMVENGCIVYDYKQKEIYFFYESREEILIEEFRKKAGTVLPKYMLPKVLIHMHELPRNTNGKIDRLALSQKVKNK